MTTGMYKTIHWKVDERIGQLVLSRPPTNHMDNLFFRELRDLVKEVIPGENLIAVLIYGKGRHFSSGADLEDLLQNVASHCLRNAENPSEPIPDFLADNLETFRFFSRLKFPVISVITGVCLGAAFELALSCHIRICANKAILGLPESSFNLLPGLGGIQNMLNCTTPMKTFEIVLGGNNFTSYEALDWGLVDKVLDKKIVQNYAMHLAGFLQGKFSRIHIQEQLKDFDRKFATYTKS